MKFKIVIIMILIFSTIGCRGRDGKQAKESIEEISKTFNTNWPIFRGDSSLTGRAKGYLPEKLYRLWTFKTGDEIKSSPIIAGSTVYIGSGDNKVYALNLNSGEKIWEFITGGPVEASPLFYKGTIFIGSSDNILYAINADNGRLKWKYNTEDQIIGSANIVLTGEPKKARILVGSYDNIMHCIDYRTGKRIWAFETDSYINGAPAVIGDKVVFGGCDAELRVLSGADGTSLATIDIGSYIAASAALVDNYAFVGHYDDKLVCIDILKKEIIWEYGDEDNRAPFFSSPAIGDDIIVAGARDNFLHCISRKNGKKIWTFQTLGEVDSSPVICYDKVVFGSMDGRLYMVQLSDGKMVWSYEIGSAISGSPAVAQNKVIIGAEDGIIYAFGGKE